MSRANFIDDVGDSPFQPAGDADPAPFLGMGFLLRRKWLILFSSVVCALLVLTLVNIVPPQYVGEAVVEPRLDAGSGASQATVATDAQPVSPELVRSEIDVVQSAPVIDSVITSLNLLNDPKLNHQGLLSRIFSPPISHDRARTQLQIVEENVLGHLKVDNDGRSFGLHIQYTAGDPERAAAVANAIAQAYLQQQLAIRTSIAQKAVQWLDLRLVYLRDNANKSEIAYADYKKEHNLFNVSQQPPADSTMASQGTQTLAVQQLAQLNNQLAAAKATSITAQSRLEAAKASGDGRGSTEVGASPIIQGLVAQEGVNEQLVANLESHYGPKYPALIAAKDQLSQVRAKLRSERENILDGIAADAAAARNAEVMSGRQLDAVKAQAATETTEQVRLDELQRQADADLQIYQQFLAKQSAAEESAASQVPSPVVVSVATPPLFPAFPKKKLMFALGSVVGVMFSVALALALDTWLIYRSRNRLVPRSRARGDLHTPVTAPG